MLKTRLALACGCALITAWACGGGTDGDGGTDLDDGAPTPQVDVGGPNDVIYSCPSGPNPTTSGQKDAGDCQTNPNSKFDPTVGGGGCSAGFAACDQLPFPYYYLNKFLVAQGQTLPVDNGMKTKAMELAEALCNSAPYESYVGLGSPTDVTWAQIASIYKFAAKAADELPAAGGPYDTPDDCAAAVIMTAGECKPTPTNTGCVANIAIWQNMGGGASDPCVGDPLGTGCFPDQSAQALFTGSKSLYALCLGPPNEYHPDEKAPTLVPWGGTDPNNGGVAWESPDKPHDAYMSACNDNYIGKFCHVNNYNFFNIGAFTFGGGQCSGGK